MERRQDTSKWNQSNRENCELFDDNAADNNGNQTSRPAVDELNGGMTVTSSDDLHFHFLLFPWKRSVIHSFVAGVRGALCA